MTIRRSPTGTGQPGRQEWGSWSRVTFETFAENSGGPVGLGLAEGLSLAGALSPGVALGAGVGLTATCSGVVDDEPGVGEPDGGVSDVPHEAARRQPAVTATAARTRTAPVARTRTTDRVVGI
ncbi:hypothetical protein AB0D67_29980 [Streptosporangium sp. NPDC048047]|uniref:hypothetical protein n=1 Tax=Streptosporangium sp. NPDC048047 TaxID=3155748 RepID=UPI0034476B89